ncbi:MAG: hypothetical protein WDM77_18250 [Steroidobacteraceae bacterium]
MPIALVWLLHASVAGAQTGQMRGDGPAPAPRLSAFRALTRVSTR